MTPLLQRLTPDQWVILLFIFAIAYHWYHGSYLAALITVFAGLHWDSLTTRGLNNEEIKLPTRAEFLRGHLFAGRLNAEEVECAICCEVYETHRRRIKLLCGHLLCVKCIDRLPCDYADERRCPFCRRLVVYRLPLPWNRIAVKLWFCGNKLMAVHDVLLAVLFLWKATTNGPDEVVFMETLLIGVMARLNKLRLQELQYGDRRMDVVDSEYWERFAGRIGGFEMALYAVSLVVAPCSIERLLVAWSKGPRY